jgi:hypothetical protein
MIDEPLAAFLQEGIAIQLATRNQRLEPDGTRVVAVAVDPAGTHVVAYVPESAARHLTASLQASGQVAIVFSRPPDERACQVKGTFEGARAGTAEEREAVVAQWNRWLDRLETIGFARAAWAHWAAWPCVAIRVRVTAIFNQTPGPGAGAPLA